jgi:hypothetical protein
MEKFGPVSIFAASYPEDAILPESLAILPEYTNRK